MATNFDSLFDTIHAGQDRRYLQQQRALQTQQQQDQATQAAASAAALPGIRQQVATGDYDGARVAAAFSGNQPIAEFVGGLQKEHQAKLSDMAGTLGSTAYALRQITDPAQRASAFQAYIPALKAHGISDTDLAAAQANLSDGALDGYINSAQTVRQHVEDAQAQAAAAAKANAPYTLAPGEARYDASGHQIARSDFKPDVTFVDNGDGTKTRVITNLDGGSGGASPAGIGATRPERNNNPGNVRALGGGQMWRGQTGTDDGGYAIFGDLASGQRAADRNLQSYGRRGVNTISGIISRWAPKADRNNTDQYIANVSRSLGIPANQPLDLTDPTVRQKLLTAGIYPNEGPTGRQLAAPASQPSPAGTVFGSPRANGGKAAPSGYRYKVDGTLEPIPGGPADPAVVGARGGSKPLTEGQAKAVGYYQRAQDANHTLNQFEDKHIPTPGTGARIADDLPFGVGSYFLSNNNQQQLNARRAFIAGVLRQESGAAISKEEFSSYDKIYFPQQGDTPATIAQKRRLRNEAVGSLKVVAGPGAAQVSGGASQSAPVRVSSPAEAARLPSGTRFITPDGRTIVKR
jgi:hypothetical protein